MTTLTLITKIIMATSKSVKSNGKQSPSHKSGSNGSSVSANGTAKKATQSASKESESMDGKEELMKLFEHALKDMYWVEKALTKAIPKMIKKATNEELIAALEDHLEVTEAQAERLEKVFQAIDKTPRGKKCVGMEGILNEGEEIMSEFEGPAINSAIIAAGGKVEHYEISSYMGMITLAETLNMPKEAALLQKSLQEEIESDQLLSRLAAKDSHQVAIENGSSHE